jgi:hypothetical protein
LKRRSRSREIEEGAKYNIVRSGQVKSDPALTCGLYYKQKHMVVIDAASVISK